MLDKVSEYIYVCVCVSNAQCQIKCRNVCKIECQIKYDKIRQWAWTIRGAYWLWPCFWIQHLLLYPMFGCNSSKMGLTSLLRWILCFFYIAGVLQSISSAFYLCWSILMAKFILNPEVWMLPPSINPSIPQLYSSNPQKDIRFLDNKSVSKMFPLYFPGFQWFPCFFLSVLGVC